MTRSDHGFFMYPPLLKAIACRRRQNRYKSSAEGGTSTKGKHQCPIYHDYSHHWYTCKEGDHVDNAAMLAERGPSKKRKKTQPASTKRSLVPVYDPMPTRMVFPALPNTTSSENQRNNTSTPSETAKKKKRSTSTSSVAAKKEKSTSTPSTASDSARVFLGRPTVKTPTPSSPDSPAMGTRSKRKLQVT
ncbi:hypothetical protein GQ55_3G465100 [Panicum hallii var. hallii]|uniref:Uncharacterized protein n=1 Tax=Panicum hallii var. hallii TaxID=1504633 RepID=A0A2T7EJ17_9POAL|nr:hypothetical protein GQ55_3G465100 [Panicum hallii var. hallii]